MTEPLDSKSSDQSGSPRSGVRWLATLGAVPMLVVLVLPLITLLFRARLAVLMQSLAERETIDAMVLSLATSSGTVILTMIFGLPLAYLLAHRLKGQRLWEVMIDLPTVLPPAVAGVALFTAFGRHGFLGPLLAAIGIEIPFTPAAVMLAQTFVAAPYFIKAASLGIANVERDLIEAAALDGASGRQTFRDVTLPLAWRGIAAGAALCWARALGEFGATIIFAGNYPGRTRTMPLAVYMGFEIDFNRALTLAVILLLISFIVLMSVRMIFSTSSDPKEPRTK